MHQEPLRGGKDPWCTTRLSRRSKTSARASHSARGLRRAGKKLEPSKKRPDEKKEANHKLPLEHRDTTDTPTPISSLLHLAYSSPEAHKVPKDFNLRLLKSMRTLTRYRPPAPPPTMTLTKGMSIASEGWSTCLDPLALTPRVSIPNFFLPPFKTL